MSEAEPEFDCLGKSQREGMPEPFVLIASDSLAPHLIALWAALKKGDTPSAVCLFADIIGDPAHKYRNPEYKPDMPKLANACKIARDMNQWRIDNNLEHFELCTVA